jgi:hypothetical protein
MVALNSRSIVEGSACRDQANSQAAILWLPSYARDTSARKAVTLQVLPGFVPGRPGRCPHLVTRKPRVKEDSRGGRITLALGRNRTTGPAFVPGRGCRRLSFGTSDAGNRRARSGKSGSHRGRGRSLARLASRTHSTGGRRMGPPAPRAPPGSRVGVAIPVDSELQLRSNYSCMKCG